MREYVANGQGTIELDRLFQKMFGFHWYVCSVMDLSG